MSRVVVALAVALLTPACLVGGSVERTVEAEVGRAVEVPPEPPVAVGAPDPDVEPVVPPFVLTSDLAEVEVTAFTYCWTVGDVGMCADGEARPEANLVASTGELVVTFVAGGELAARIGPGDAPQREIATVAGGDGWSIDLTDLEAGDHQLWLSWNGAEGDAHAALTLRVVAP